MSLAVDVLRKNAEDHYQTVAEHIKKASGSLWPGKKAYSG